MPVNVSVKLTSTQHAVIHEAKAVVNTFDRQTDAHFKSIFQRYPNYPLSRTMIRQAKQAVIKAVISAQTNSLRPHEIDALSRQIRALQATMAFVAVTAAQIKYNQTT